MIAANNIYGASNIIYSFITIWWWRWEDWGFDEDMFDINMNVQVTATNANHNSIKDRMDGCLYHIATRLTITILDHLKPRETN